MGTENLHITSWVMVRNGVAVQNDSLFLEMTDTDPLSFIKALYKQIKCDYPKFYKMDNLCKLAFISAELLLKNVKLIYGSDEIAVVLSNSSSSFDTDKTYYQSVGDKSNYFPSPAVFVYTLPNIMMGEICIRHQFLGENAFFISEVFNSGILSDYTENLLNSGKAKCVITGWVEINESGWDAALFLIERTAKENEEKRLSKEHLNEIYALKRITK